MPKDWKDIGDDDILNYEGAQTGDMARYERIMQKRSIDALHSVNDKLVGLTGTLYRASQGLKEKSDELIGLYDKFSKAQSRQQNVVISLSVVVALSALSYTFITWQSVTAVRESNQIQREFLKLERLKSETPVPPDQSLENRSE